MERYELRYESTRERDWLHTCAGDACAVAAGGTHTCALLSDGQIKCWGQNAFGALGIGDAGVSQTAVPTTVTNLSGNRTC